MINDCYGSGDLVRLDLTKNQTISAHEIGMYHEKVCLVLKLLPNDRVAMVLMPDGRIMQFLSSSFQHV